MKLLDNRNFPSPSLREKARMRVKRLNSPHPKPLPKGEGKRSIR